jgi:V8-like Glu-specific endopeptidase
VNGRERVTQPMTEMELASRQDLEAEVPAPDEVTITLSTLQLPRGARASLVEVDGADGVYQVRVALPGDAIGHRTPYDRIPARGLEAVEVDMRALAEVDPDGLRPRHLRVAFHPNEVRLGLNERAMPPADFDYRRDDELVDRPTNVFAPDERFVYQDTSFPWATVGRVDTPLGTCTGSTIGRRLLLTGSHCIQWNNNGTAGWVRFRPAYFNGSAPFGEAWATQVIFWMQATGGDGLTDQETAFDYVICVLDSPIGDTVGFPGFREYESSWNGGNYWQHMGYPSDLTGSQRPAFQGGCVVSSVGNQSTAGQTGYVLGHFNDVVPGHSGGPVWGWWSGEPWPRVVGTQSAEAAVPAMNTSGDNEFGGGPALSALIAWARSNFP